jgi:hypothetical protein
MKPYELLTVKQLLEEELEAVKELHQETNDPILPNVIEYLERRLAGTIGGNQ